MFESEYLSTKDPNLSYNPTGSYRLITFSRHRVANDGLRAVLMVVCYLILKSISFKKIKSTKSGSTITPACVTGQATKSFKKAYQR